MSNDLGNKEVFAKNLKYYMELNHVSRMDICNNLNVAYSTLADWLHAKTYPRIDKIERLALCFGISKADLVEKNQKKEPPITTDENQLLESYRKLNVTGKDVARSVIEGLSLQPQYKAKEGNTE